MTSGIVLIGVVAPDAQAVGSTEQVFERIDFTDFLVTFAGNTTEPFDIARGFADPASTLRMRENGRRRFNGDNLFPRGLELVL